MGVDPPRRRRPHRRRPRRSRDAGSPTRHRLRRAIATWPENENLVVSVGLWWLCRRNFQQKWSRLFSATASLPRRTRSTGRLLPPGGHPRRRRSRRVGGGGDRRVGARGARGWREDRAGGPAVSQGRAVARGRTRMDRRERRGGGRIARRRRSSRMRATSLAAGIEPVLFVFQAGFAAKTIITELAHPSRRTSKDMYVDAGTALDGFAGKGSRAFNRATSGDENIARTSSSGKARTRRDGSRRTSCASTGASWTAKSAGDARGGETRLGGGAMRRVSTHGGAIRTARGSPTGTRRVETTWRRPRRGSASARDGRRTNAIGGRSRRWWSSA